MKQYRIKVVTSLTADKTSYEIEETDFFGFWIPCAIPTMYFIHQDYNADPVNGGLLIKRHMCFSHKEMARELIELKKRSLIPIRYKKQKIVEMYNEYSGKSVYVNKSYFRFWNNSCCYDFAYTLEEMKDKIDKRFTKPIITYVGF